MQMSVEKIKDKARQLAAYLREHGVETARILLIKAKDGGSPEWATVVWVPSLEDKAEYLANLSQVPTPPFEMRLPAAIPRLKLQQL